MERFKKIYINFLNLIFFVVGCFKWKCKKGIKICYLEYYQSPTLGFCYTYLFLFENCVPKVYVYPKIDPGCIFVHLFYLGPSVCPFLWSGPLPGNPQKFSSVCTFICQTKTTPLLGGYFLGQQKQPLYWHQSKGNTNYVR